jgi:hypothetical protein
VTVTTFPFFSISLKKLNNKYKYRREKKRDRSHDAVVTPSPQNLLEQTYTYKYIDAGGYDDDTFYITLFKLGNILKNITYNINITYCFALQSNRVCKCHHIHGYMHTFIHL